MELSECLLVYCIGGIEFEDGDEVYQTATFPSPGQEVQFDDPQYDHNLNGRPFNKTPQRSPVPEYTENEPQIEVSPEVIGLEDGFINLYDPKNKQLAESLRQQNTNCSVGDSKVPESSEEKKEDKGIDPYRVCHDPDPRQDQELVPGIWDFSDVKSPKRLEPEPEPVVDTPPEKRLSRFKRFKRFVRSLCCWTSDPEPSLPKRSPPSTTMADVTTVQVFRTYSDAEICRAVRELPKRRRSCSF